MFATLSRCSTFLVLKRAITVTSVKNGLRPSPFISAASSCLDQCHVSDQRKRGGGGDFYTNLMKAGLIGVVIYWAYSEFFHRKYKSIISVRCVEDNERRSKKYNFLAEAVEIAAPSVVFIERRQNVKTVFGDSTAISSGSGFIVDESGYVLTNAHVVGITRQVTVKLHNGRILNGEVTDIDQVADLALVKLALKKGEKLPAIEFGSSAKLRPGEWVIALGSPRTLSNTITSGIVSSVHRPSFEIGLHREKPDMEYIQTDAAITVGNSGGPLVNLDGKVIGINTMTLQPGISFAIPSDFAKHFLKHANKSVTHLTKYGIGISMLTISSSNRYSIQTKFDVPPDICEGIFLANVWPGSPADKAGLMKGDIIVKINNQKVKSSREVYQMVQLGQLLQLEVVRGKKMKYIKVRPEPM